jgi:outer membrane protein assembly factor BamA
MQSGDIFDTWQVGKAIEGMRKLYWENGYINMSVVPTTQVEEGGESIVLTLEMDEGPQFRVGKVEVLGADEAKSRQFVSQSGLITGSVYDHSRLQKAFVSESDGSEAMEDSVLRTIHDAEGTVDFKVDLRPCVAMSQK